MRRDKLSVKRRKIRRTWMRYAAMFMIPLGVAVALLSRNDVKEKSQVEPITVKAGKSQAVLACHREKGKFWIWGKKYRGRGHEN